METDRAFANKQARSKILRIEGGPAPASTERALEKGKVYEQNTNTRQRRIDEWEIWDWDLTMRAENAQRAATLREEHTQGLRRWLAQVLDLCKRGLARDDELSLHSTARILCAHAERVQQLREQWKSDLAALGDEGPEWEHDRAGRRIMEEVNRKLKRLGDNGGPIGPHL